MNPVCPLCKADATEEFLRRDQVPAHQNLLYATRAEARRATRATLSMRFCSACGFIFNGEFDPAKLAYGPEYDNSQDCSPAFGRHVDDLIRHLIEDRGLRGGRIVEVGCGKGAFIRKLVATPCSAIEGHGFDPSYSGPDTALDGRLTFHRRFFGAESAGLNADAVVCRHVIEHVADPVGLLGSVRAALAEGTGARVFFETPCVAWVLRNRVIWDFFYEHCSLFTAGSLATAFQLAGFRVESVRHVFDEQYLWLEAVPAAAEPAPVRHAGDIAPLAREYAASDRQMREEWRARIVQLVGQGSVAVWGAGAKGSTFVNLVDPDGSLIDCVVDLNPAKQGRFIPGSGHPIVDYGQLPQRKVKNAVLMNPNYRQENLSLLRAAGIDVNLLG